MDVVFSNEITIHEPTKEVTAYCEENLFVRNPEYDKKARLGLWVGSTPKTLRLYKTAHNAVIVPIGAYRGIRAAVSDISRAPSTSDFASNAPVDYDADIPLYDYQQQAVDALLRRGYGILQSKAGSGKTRCGIATICKLGKKTLWLTHTNELLNQSYKAAAEFIDKKKLGKIAAGKVEIGEGITFATVQTMSKMDLANYKYEWDCVVVDECHRVAGTPTKATMFSKVISALAARNKYGLSATLHRSDGLIKCALMLLGETTHIVPDDVVNVMDVRVCKIDTGTPISMECLDTDGTLVYSKLITYLAHNAARNRLIVQDIAHNAGHSNIMLSDRVEQLNLVCDAIPDAFKDRVAIMHGKVSKRERDKILDDMRSGKKKILLATYQLAKEGLDVPCLDRLYLATPVKDYAIVVQSVGRIARVCEGKGEPVVYDYVDDIGYLQGMYRKRCTSYRKCGCKL